MFLLLMREVLPRIIGHFPRITPIPDKVSLANIVSPRAQINLFELATDSLQVSCIGCRPLMDLS